MSDWKQDLARLREQYTTPTNTKGETIMSDKTTIGIKFTEQYGLRVDAPPSFIGKKVRLIIDRTAGRFSLQFDPNGNTFTGNNNNQKAMVTFGYKHLGNIRKYTSEYVKVDAVHVADGIFVSNFELPAKQRATRVTSFSKPTMGRTPVGRESDDATLADLRAALRTLNHYGRQLGVEWAIEDGKVVGALNVKRKL